MRNLVTRARAACAHAQRARLDSSKRTAGALVTMALLLVVLGSANLLTRARPPLAQDSDFQVLRGSLRFGKSIFLNRFWVAFHNTLLVLSALVLRYDGRDFATG